MKRVIAIIILMLVGMVGGAEAQTPACTWPSGAAMHDTNTTGQYVAWADGGAVYWMRCVDLVTIQMFTGSTPTLLYFDGTWLPYNLYYTLADGSSWQISVVSPHNPVMISPPFNPAVTDTPGESHAGEETITISPTMDAPLAPPLALTHDMNVFGFKLRRLLGGLFR